MAQNPTISKMETTAVEWLKDMLEWNYGDPQMLEISWKNLDDLFERAKAMEKEQIKKAFSDGQETPIDHPTLPHYSREEYYNDTYSKRQDIPDTDDIK